MQLLIQGCAPQEPQDAINGKPLPPTGARIMPWRRRHEAILVTRGRRAQVAFTAGQDPMNCYNVRIV